MEELKNCLNLRRQIDEINEKIYALKAVILSPKNQIITGMPRAGSTDNAIDRYLLKLERLESKKKTLRSLQSTLWNNIKTEAKKAELTEQEIRLLYMRFVRGYPWKRCAVRLNKKYGNWNINKVFRIYRQILNALSKQMQNNQ